MTHLSAQQHRHNGGTRKGGEKKQQQNKCLKFSPRERHSGCDTSCVVHDIYSRTWQSEFTDTAATTITISSSLFLLQESSSVLVGAVSQTVIYTCLSHSRLCDFSCGFSYSWITFLFINTNPSSLPSPQAHVFLSLLILLTCVSVVVLSFYLDVYKYLLNTSSISGALSGTSKEPFKEPVLVSLHTRRPTSSLRVV